MFIAHTPSELQLHLSALRSQGKTVGFVPTMGALHNGHLKLIEQSKHHADHTVVSIFVNPLQFNNPEDLLRYPRTIEDDLDLLSKTPTNLVFVPSENILSYVQNDLPSYPAFESALEGKYRPGHFHGVKQIVHLFLKYVNPDFAFFGLKDLQQYLLVKQLASQLFPATKIVGVPTQREQNGLAMSSRNQRLSEDGKFNASKIYSGLQQAETDIKSGKTFGSVLDSLHNFYSSEPSLSIEYCEIVDTSSFQRIEAAHTEADLAICVAGYVEGIRLIDNLYLRSQVKKNEN